MRRSILSKRILSLLSTFLLSGLLLIEAPAGLGNYQTGDLTPVAYLPFLANMRSPIIGGCPVFPYNNVWNTPVDHLPAATNSNSFTGGPGLGWNRQAHADFGSGVWPEGSDSPIGIPYLVVPGTQPKVPIHFSGYGDESDPGPYPIPANAPIEGGPSGDGDRHVLIVDQGTCMLYELYSAYPNPDGSWEAGSGAVFDLRANAPLRPAGWTSADAAGLTILAGLVRYDEVAAGEIRHALRFTGYTSGDYVWPARHRADNHSDCDFCPKMGQRYRLKASVDISSAGPQARVVLQAMKKYGLIMSDNGTPWYVSGAPDPRWNNSDLRWLHNLTGEDFELVDTSSMKIESNSGEAKQPPP